MMECSKKFKIVDILYLIMMFLPILAGIVIKVIITPAKEGIEISGALIYFTLNMPVQNFPITESQLNSVIVIISVLFLCLYMTHGIKNGVWLKRHYFAELIVEKTQKMVEGNMGVSFKGYTPFIVAILALSAFSSLITLFGLYPPTSDLNIVAGWAILVFGLITFYKARHGLGGYIKSIANPPLMAPLNLISEVATPISMAFRHYGNVLSGSVIAVLVASGLQGLSQMLLGFLPGFLGQFPFLQIGIPAILSVYFDIFSGCLQAYIFAMLTMLYVSGGEAS